MTKTFKITTQDGIKRTLKVDLREGQTDETLQCAVYRAGAMGRVTSATVQLALDTMTLEAR